MKKNHLISILIIILVYVAASMLIHKSYILPGITDILVSLKDVLLSGTFLKVVFTTLYRTFIGLLISFFIALVLALCAYFNETVRELLHPLYVLLKTIPNITYIIVALLWLGRNGSVILVASLVVFPIFYNSILNALLNIDDSLIKVTRLYQGPILHKIIHVYLPLIKKDILAALGNCCSLGFKVSIMAEILSQVKSGIGKELYYAKANFLMADIFAWTILIILISSLFDHLISLFNKED